jgi:hypothetical protein
VGEPKVLQLTISHKLGHYNQVESSVSALQSGGPSDEGLA